MAEQNSIESVAVIGGGLMGSGIAQVVAQAGLQVTVVDINEQALARTLQRIERSLERLVGAGKLGAGEVQQVLGRLTTTTELEAAAAAGHVIETVVEELEIKLDVLRRLDELCPD